MNAEVDVQQLLGAASQLVKDGKWSDAFDALLDAWRALRAAEIATLCELLSARAARTKKIEGKSQTERVVTWAKAFHERSALGLGVLLADLDAAWGEDAQPRFIVPRIEALATVRDDPRVATAMFDALTNIGYGNAWQKVVRCVLRGLEAAGDPRAVDRLEAFGAERPYGDKPIRVMTTAWGTKSAETLRKKMKMKERTPALPAELRSIVESVRSSIESIPTSLVIAIPGRAKAVGAEPAALLDQVRSSPDDNELRLILADALVAAGDPLGEFIVLQSRRASGETTPKTLARERALLRANMKTWLGAIAPVVKLKSAVFERGFLDRCEAVAHKQVQAQVHFQHAEWATVRSISFQHASRITPAMRSLREARNVDEHGIKHLAEAGHPLLERLGVGNAVSWYELARAPLVACPASLLPKLVHFEINGGWLDIPRLEWVWDAPWSKQLKSFGVPAQETQAWMDEFRKREHLEEIRFDTLMGLRSIIRKAPGGELDVRVQLDLEGSLPPYAEQGIKDLFTRLTGISRIREVVVEARAGLVLPPPQRDRIRDFAATLKSVPKVTLPFPD